MNEIPKAFSARKGEKDKPASRNINKDRGTAFERKVSKATGGKRIPTSGAGSIKGDVQTRYTLIECKASARLDAAGGKVMQLKRDWLTKAAQEAEAEGKRIAILAIHYMGDAIDYGVLPFPALVEMLTDLERYYALQDWLSRNPSVADMLPQGDEQ